MQCSVTIVVELAPEADVSQMEAAIQEAGRQAMRAALRQAVRSSETAHAACPHCGGTQSQGQGTVTRRVSTCFGRVVLALRRQRCAACGRRFRPAQACLAALAGGNVTPELGAACALAGASWAYATAARVLQRLCGAQVSDEEVRRWTNRLGDAEVDAQQAAAERLLAPTAEQVRAERDVEARRQRLGCVGAAPPPPQLVVGWDGGWLPSREQRGGMEGKVGVVATGGEIIGKRGRHRLTPRRYVATFGDSAQIGALTYAAATALGGEAAQEQLVLGDGAAWIKAQATRHFPDAVGILDWAHLDRAVHKAIRAARPGRAQRALRRELHRTLPDLLWHGDVEAALTALTALRPTSPTADPIARLEDAIAYLRSQRAWLGDYATWQAAGYPVGSGLIERAVALVINRRMKRQGMRWRRANASAVVALRVREFNADWDGNDDLTSLPAA